MNLFQKERGLALWFVWLWFAWRCGLFAGRGFRPRILFKSDGFGGLCVWFPGRGVWFPGRGVWFVGRRIIFMNRPNAPLVGCVAAAAAAGAAPPRRNQGGNVNVGNFQGCLRTACCCGGGKARNCCR